MSDAFPAEVEHEHWRDYKLAEGWRYGPVLDQWDRTDPRLVPFADLDERGAWIRRLTPPVSASFEGLLTLVHCCKEWLISLGAPVARCGRCRVRPT